MRKPTIAVIDDNQDTREMIKTFLEPSYEVHSYRDALEAFEKMKVIPPQAVVTDILLADHDGMELLRWMRADPLLRRVPAVALSGLAYKKEMQNVGFNHYLLKPVDLDDLLQALSDCLGTSANPDAFKIAS
jgi:CheY-like chemotaxis protein